MEKDILTIIARGDDAVVHIPDDDLAVMTISDIIWDAMKQNRHRALNLLFSILVHTLARDLSGKLQEEFLENIRKTVPAYRNVYKKMLEQKKNAS